MSTEVSKSYMVLVIPALYLYNVNVFEREKSVLVRAYVLQHSTNFHGETPMIV